MIFDICSYCLLFVQRVPTFHYPGVDHSDLQINLDRQSECLRGLALWHGYVSLVKDFIYFKKTLQHVICTHSHHFLPHTLLCSAWRHQKPAGQGQTIDPPVASKWWHGAIYKWHWQAVITVNERAEESTVNLSLTFVNPSVVSAHDDLTSKEKKKTFGHFDSSIVCLFMQICAFVSELGRRWQKISCARINRCTILA